MYTQDYMWFMVAILVCIIFSGFASSKVKRTFLKHDKIQCRSGCTGYDTVSRLMFSNGVNGISIGSVKGFLTDHYNPKKSIINLSESTYNNSSVAAVAVAAHEMGHVMQRQEGYGFYKLRTSLVPVVNFGSLLAIPLVLVGLLLDWYSMSANADIGFKVALIGVILYGGSLVFALVTLPVEFNASKRASEMLSAAGILAEDELPAVKEVLSAAALTYLASFLTSLVYFLRFLIRVLALFGRRGRR